MRHTYARVLAVVAFAGLLSSPPATTALLADDQMNNREREGGRPLDPHATYRGLTYGDWSAQWWQAGFANWEAGSDPAANGGAFGGNNRMVFLSAPVVPAGTPKFTFRVTIPPGTHLFVPIITVECSVAEAPPFHGENEAELRVCANDLLNKASDLYAEIDGRRVNDPGAYRADSPLFRYGPLTEDNVLLLPPATQSDAVGAGYYLLLPPFSGGVHRITVRANVAEFGISVDAKFIINVEPSHGR